MKRSRKVKKTVGQRITYGIVFVILAFFSLSYVAAMLWGFLAGLNSSDGVVMAPFVFPERLHFENYAEVFSHFVVNRVNYGGMILNSLWLTLGGALIDVSVAAGLGYVTSKYDFRGAKLIHAVALIVMIVPMYGSLPSRYRLIYTIHFNDSPLYLLTYTLAIGFEYLMSYSFFKSVPWSYAEAAFIDGANDFTVFFRIMLPLAFAPLSALFVIQSIGIWNDWQSPLLFLKRAPTLATGLYLYNATATQDSRIDLLLAGTMMSIIPVMLLFLFFNKALLNQTVAGGLKG